ncbi:MAG: amidohydrolase family protein [Myxococcota bacterium]|nr:amidohydrolase family protein [Myxococcota bacterium]
MSDPSSNRNPSRRDFVRMLGGTAVLAATGCAAPPPPTKVRGEGHAPEPPLTGLGPIDAHIHMWSPSASLYPRTSRLADQVLKPRRYTPRDFLTVARNTGVERAVLVQAAVYGEDHSYMLDVMAEYPGRFAGVGTVDRTPRPEERLRELGAMGLRGARVISHTGCERWSDDERYQALFRMSAETGLVLDLLTLPEHLLAMDALCAQVPSAIVAVPHLGRPPGDRHEREEHFQRLIGMARRPGVVLKWSGLHMLALDAAHYDELAPVFSRVLDAFGPERIMWGSDAPHQFRKGNGYEPSLQWIRDRDELSESELDQILRGTAERIYFS